MKLVKEKKLIRLILLAFAGFWLLVGAEYWLIKKISQQSWEEKKKTEKFLYEGEANIREYALVEKIIDQQTYELKLDSGKTLVFVLDEDTFIGNALLGYNQEGEIVQTEYIPISKDELKKITLEERVAVRYWEKDLGLDERIKALEFITLE